MSTPYRLALGFSLLLLLFVLGYYTFGREDTQGPQGVRPASNTARETRGQTASGAAPPGTRGSERTPDAPDADTAETGRRAEEGNGDARQPPTVTLAPPRWREDEGGQDKDAGQADASSGARSGASDASLKRAVSGPANRRGDGSSSGSDEPAAATPDEEGARKYVVRRGETLRSIAVRLYGTQKRWVDLARANPEVDPARLRPGQVLRLPEWEKEEAQAEQGEASQEDENAGAAEARRRRDGPPPPEEAREHVVQSGETLTEIAETHYGTSRRWRTIYEANKEKIGADPDQVRAGMELVIPPVAGDDR